MKKALYFLILSFLLIVVVFKSSAYSNDEPDFIFNDEWWNAPKTTRLSIGDTKGSYLCSLPNAMVLPQAFTITEEEKEELINFISSTDFFSLDQRGEEDECPSIWRDVESLSIKIDEKYNAVSIRCASITDKRFKTVIAISQKVYQIIGDKIRPDPILWNHTKPLKEPTEQIPLVTGEAKKKLIRRKRHEMEKAEKKPIKREHSAIKKGGEKPIIRKYSAIRKAGQQPIRRKLSVIERAGKEPIKRIIPLTKTSGKISIKNRNLLLKPQKKKVAVMPSVKKTREKPQPRKSKLPLSSRLIQFVKELIGY